MIEAPREALRCPTSECPERQEPADHEIESALAMRVMHWAEAKGPQILLGYRECIEGQPEPPGLFANEPPEALLIDDLNDDELPDFAVRLGLSLEWEPGSKPRREVIAILRSSFDRCDAYFVGFVHGHSVATADTGRWSVDDPQAGPLTMADLLVVAERRGCREKRVRYHFNGQVYRPQEEGWHEQPMCAGSVPASVRE